MSAGVWLVAVGLCDLLRATQDGTSARRRALLVVIGLAVLATLGVSLGLAVDWWAGVGLLWGVGLTGWVLTSSIALDPRTPRPSSWRSAAFAFFAAPLALLVLVGDQPFRSLRSALPLDATPLARFGTSTPVVYAGVALVLVSTANVLVRLLLDAVGVPAAVNEKRLKGGRVLGPMERVFVLVLATLGQLGAASIVVAAKALLRYPELRRDEAATNGAGAPGDAAATDTSEYFLIGSFASWLLASGGWGLVLLLTSVQ